MEVDIIITVAMATAFIVFVNQVGRILRARMLHRTIREGISRDSALTGELLDRIDGEKPASGSMDDRTAIVLVAIGLAVLGFGALTGSEDNFRSMAGIALFPLFVGAALLGRHILLRRRSADGA